MSRTIGTIWSKLSKNKGTSVPELAAKTGRYLRESVTALLCLRPCTRVGVHARVVGFTRVVNRGRIELGDDVRLISRWTPIELSTQPGGSISIGDGSAINYGTIVSAASKVTIGRRAMIGNYCVIADTQVPGTPADARDVAAPIEIGDDVWLAVRVTVLPGSKIGSGAVISAGSVVDGEIPAGALAGGVPARVLRASVRPSSPPETSAVPDGTVVGASP
jgi:acetyltransferase-like isoleucine patch superfamily enzyme